MNKNQNIDRQTDRVRSDLQWLGYLVRDIKFGTIRGVLVRDGVIGKGPKFRVTRTGKPGGKSPSGTRVVMAGDAALQEALRDLAREILTLKGKWKLKIKVANGSLLSWEVEEVGLSTFPEAK